VHNESQFCCCQNPIEASGFTNRQRPVAVATRREELIWTEPEMTQIAPSDEESVVVDDRTLALPL
jgi:hypothetical protein